MATTLSDIRFTVERDVEDTIDNQSIVDWANIAQNEFMMRIYIPDSMELVVNTSDVSYDLSAYNIREIRRIRRKSDLDNNINRSYNPVYTFYNDIFEVPGPFLSSDTLLIDFYRFMKFFSDIDDEIDLNDRFFPLYTTYIKAQYFQFPSTSAKLGVERAALKHQESMSAHNMAKKQVADYYIASLGTERVKESGWGVL